MAIIEYLGKNEITVSGVGTFGGNKFDRKSKKWVRGTRLEASDDVCSQFTKNSLFKVHGLSKLKVKKEGQ